MKSLLIFGIGTGELIVIALVILLFFGASRIPALMKSLGKGVKSFKQGVAEAESEIKKAVEDTPEGEK